MIEKIKCLVAGIFLAFVGVACSSDSGSGNKAGLESFLGGGNDLDMEQLHNVMTEEMVDSAGVREYLKEADLPNELQDDFISFYRSRNFEPAWIDEDGVKKAAERFLEEVEKSTEHGLSPEDYKLQYLYHLKKSLDQPEVELKSFQKFDKELTTAYLKLANHILRGRIEPSQFDSTWKTDRRERALARHLLEALEEGSIEESLKSLEPQYEGYRGLKDALARYQKLKEENPKWEPLPESLTLKPGDSSKYVPQLARMLHILGDAEDIEKDNKVYNEELVEAVATFQKRNGLVTDSILSEKTIKMLNVPLEERIAQIKLNLERFRWLPERPEGRHVVVNIPEYLLYVYEGADSTFSMRVIVGKAYESTTPIFNDSISYLTFSPTWTVPPTIAGEEMLPKLQEDPLYLTRQGFKIYESWKEEAKEVNPEHIEWEKIPKEEFPYRVVQNPGPNNSLGRVKFMFPNQMAIYLHDTPADYLFSREERDFSHGCIRVERPVDFAHYLLQDQGISKEEIKELMSMEEPKDIPLEEKVPVFIEYRTAWMGYDGRVNFREDIYGHDQTQLGTLKEAVSEVQEGNGK